MRTLSQLEELAILQHLDLQHMPIGPYGLALPVGPSSPTKRKRLRNVAAFLLMLDAGMRVGETALLPVSACVYAGKPTQVIVVPAYVAKRAHTRNVPTTARLRAAIARLPIIQSPPDQLDPNTPLITTPQQTESLTTRQLERIITAAAQTSIGRPVNPHLLRHTYATKMMSLTDMRTVQTLLGHKNLSSTQIYTHVSDNHLIAASAALDATIASRPGLPPGHTLSG